MAWEGGCTFIYLSFSRSSVWFEKKLVAQNRNILIFRANAASVGSAVKRRRKVIGSFTTRSDKLKRWFNFSSEDPSSRNYSTWFTLVIFVFTKVFPDLFNHFWYDPHKFFHIERKISELQILSILFVFILKKKTFFYPRELISSIASLTINWLVQLQMYTVYSNDTSVFSTNFSSFSQV